MLVSAQHMLCIACTDAEFGKTHCWGTRRVHMRHFCMNYYSFYVVIHTLKPSLVPFLPSLSSYTLTHSLPPSLSPSLSHSLPLSLPPSLTPSLTPSFPLSLPPSLTPSLTPSLPHSLPHSLTPSLTPSLPHSLPLSLLPSLPPSLTPSLSPSLPPSLPLPPSLDVPTWLKSLRLHKYAQLFAPLAYEDMLDITDEYLEKNVSLLSLEWGDDPPID